MKLSLFGKRGRPEPDLNLIPTKSSTAYMRAPVDEALRQSWSDDQLEKGWRQLSPSEKNAHLSATQALAQPVRVGGEGRRGSSGRPPFLVRDLQRIAPADQPHVLRAAVLLFGHTDAHEGHVDELIVLLSQMKGAHRPGVLKRLLDVFFEPDGLPCQLPSGYQAHALADRRLRTLRALLSGGPRAQDDKLNLLALFRPRDADTLSQYRLAALLERLRNQQFESEHFAAVKLWKDKGLPTTLDQAHILEVLQRLAASPDPMMFAADGARSYDNSFETKRQRACETTREETSARDRLGGRGVPSMVGPGFFS